MAENRGSYNKIPYDDQPIQRQTSYKGSAPKRTESGNVGGSQGLSKGLALLVCVLLLINLILGGLLVSAIRGKNNSVNKTEVSINTSGGLDVSAVATKAKMSVVLVHSGMPDGGVVNSESTFFNMKTKGAGVIFEDNKEDGSAYILTCRHVVASSNDTTSGSVYVMLFDSNTPISARVVSSSRIYDVAVLQIEKSSVYQQSTAKACEVANSSYISVGEGVVAIGNPLGKGFSVTGGVVSKTNDFILTSGVTKRGIRTDAAINEGNSGGGLFNAEGQLVGITNAKDSSSVENMAYAIHSNVALNLARNMIRNDRPVKAVLGMEFESRGTLQDIVDGKLLSVEQVYISSVELGSAAAQGGLSGNGTEQVLGFAIDGKYYNMMDRYTFEDYSFTLERGDKVTFTLLVNGRQRTVTITIDRVVSVDSQQWYD